MKDSLQKLSASLDQHLFDHLLPFWSGPAIDHERGGWMAWLSNDLRPDRTQPKGLIVHSRILWAFSAAFRRRPDPLFKQMADRALAYLTSRFMDPQHGGAFWRLNDDGSVLDSVKKIYGQAFCIYSLVEYHEAFGSQNALEAAQRIFNLIETHAHDETHGGYFEVCSTDWSQVLDVPLSDKDLNEKKSMNTHLHVLEAYTSLHRVWKDPRVTQRLHELLELFQTRILDARTHHLHHFFDEAWNVRSDNYTYGHDIEASWLLCEAADEIGGGDISRRAHGTALRIADAVLNEAECGSGGIAYEGRGGQVVDPRRECWPQAEAVVGLLNAYQLSREHHFLDASLRTWNFIDAHLVDRVNGDWFWRINEDGRPDPTLPKVSEWKGPYHATRMGLESLRRLAQIS